MRNLIERLMARLGYVPESVVLVLRFEAEGALHQAARERAARRYAERQLEVSVESYRVALEGVRERSHGYA